MSDSVDHQAADGRRAQLLGVKLRALVSEHLGRRVSSEPVGFAQGAWLIDDEQLWVLADAEGRWGAALALALRKRTRSLQLITDVGAGEAARGAGELGYRVDVWRTDPADQRRLVRAEPEPSPTPPEPFGSHLEFADLITGGGARLHVEFGVVTGEVCGLEVCRVVGPESEPRLEVGVGANDREAFVALHGDHRPEQSLARVVSVVAQHRRAGADHHPLNRLAAERLLRWRLQVDPQLVGATDLEPDQPPTPRPSLARVAPCVATGVDAAGRRVTVVCSSGVDLDLVPFVADTRRAVTERRGVDHSMTAHRLMVAIPSRDRLGIVAEMIGLLAQAPGWSEPELVAVD